MAVSYLQSSKKEKRYGATDPLTNFLEILTSADTTPYGHPK